MSLKFYHFVNHRHPVIYYPFGARPYLFHFFLRHNPASVLHPNASVSTQSKMDQFSCFAPFSPQFSPPIQIFLHSELYATVINPHKVVSDRVP